MNALNPSPCSTLDTRFLRMVEAWCTRNNATEGAFGTAVCRDRGFVASLREGRRPRLGTVDRALAVMGEPLAGPAFQREVEAFLAATGTKRSLLGLKATGNPSFVAHLCAGVSPSLATVEAVRAWMAGNADAAERREIRTRTGAIPSFLTGDPLPSPEPRYRPEVRDPGIKRPGQRTGDGRYVATREAAERLGLAPATLARYRITGKGPCYFRFGTCVRYRAEDLEAWEAGHWRSRWHETTRLASP
ncbi:MAG: helix-turn-helix domain-containing protein [Gemmatimonadota bacterium]|nr:helix-turn-helix domain-containing protein [Gemmatimonadota bacterium]